MKKIHNFSSFILEEVNPATSSTTRSKPLVEPPKYITTADTLKNDQTIKVGNRVTTINAEMMNNIDWEKSFNEGHLYGKDGKIKMRDPQFDLTSETGIDLAVDVISSVLDSIPAGYTQATSLTIDVLHALSFIYRWKQAQKDEDRWVYFITGLVMLFVCWLPRAGNMISKKFIEKQPLLRKILQGLTKSDAITKNTIEQYGGKNAYILYKSIMTFFKDNGMENTLISGFPSPDKIQAVITGLGQNKVARLLLGNAVTDPNSPINKVIPEILGSYKNLFAGIQKADKGSKA
ncbi:hypothetical protein EBU71_04625 [bacterium]|nr:hypothetical protein [Candidatus Elulimicrobium humile]